MPRHLPGVLATVTGILTISVEVELAWGNHDTGRLERLSSDGSTERAYLEALLETCAAADVPISFDVVGHLLMDACAGDHPGPHRRGWFQADPGTDYRTDPLFYAPDAVEAIQASDTGHEVCSHTFSHVLFDEVPRRVGEWELRRTQELHRERTGSATTSLVPPRHRTPPYDLLCDAGIEVVRPPMNRPRRSRPGRFRELLAGPEPLSTLAVRDGVVETYCTTNPSLVAPAFPLGQGGVHPAFRHLPVSLRRRLHLRKLKDSTRRAAREDAHLHLWCHLFDLSNELQWETVRAYLAWLGSYRADEDLQVATMEELPGLVRG